MAANFSDAKLCLLLVVITLCTSTVTVGLPRPDQEDQEDILSTDLRLHNSKLFGLLKRTCDGFPCMYSHLGANAGRQALMRTLMSIIDDCAGNPACSPGRRRRKRALQNLALEDKLETYGQGDA